MFKLIKLDQTQIYVIIFRSLNKRNSIIRLAKNIHKLLNFMPNIIATITTIATSASIIMQQHRFLAFSCLMTAACILT
jgi:hypothetical protein